VQDQACHRQHPVAVRRAEFLAHQDVEIAKVMQAVEDNNG